MGKINDRTVPSDALVLFGVTGDLAHKMIFPALYAMAKRGALKVPIIGVAFPEWSLAQLCTRVTDSIKRSSGIDDRQALQHLLSLLHYVGGDYHAPATFSEIKKTLGRARRPAHYLAFVKKDFHKTLANCEKTRASVKQAAMETLRTVSFGMKPLSRQTSSCSSSMAPRMR